MKHIQTGKVLIITDIHQCILGFIERVLEREKDWDHIILNGDWFDTFQDIDNITHVGMKETCKYINRKRIEWGDRASWHMGNHDVAYLASYRKDYAKTQINRHYYCSGWTANKAKKFNKHIDPAWFGDLKLCTRVGHYHVSHAGFNYQQGWKSFMSEEDNIQEMYDKWEADKSHFMHTPDHWIWNVGACRGGYNDVGSPVWLDWAKEFYPQDNINQIVGHTTNMHHREYNDNFCIDALQGCYGIWQNNQFEVKYL
jgi:hypothetical protein